MKNIKNILLTFILILILALTGCNTNSTGSLSSSCNAPVIRSVQILDKQGNPLSTHDGWILLTSDNIIKVDYDGPATKIDFYTTPTGTESNIEQSLLGTVDVAEGANSGQFFWHLDDNYMGFVWVLVYNRDVARTSDTNEFVNNVYYEVKSTF